MTIRDIAIAIGFDLDEQSLKKAEESINSAKKRWEESLNNIAARIRVESARVSNRAPEQDAPRAAGPLPAKETLESEQQITEELREQEEVTQEVLSNHQQINRTVSEQKQRQTEVVGAEREAKANTQQNVQAHLKLRDVLAKIFKTNKDNSRETRKGKSESNRLFNVLNKVWGKCKQIVHSVKSHRSEAEKVKTTYQEISGKMQSLIGALGLGFSLVQLKQISEEFNGINDQIRDATRGMGEQSEIQQRILKAANDSRTSYGETAKFVGNLVQENKELFGTVEEAAGYAELTSKLFKAAGKSNEQVASLQEAINNSFGRGKLDGETISQLLENAPEYVKLLEKELGATKDQFEDMATNGQISLAALKNAVVNNADTINASFNELDLNLSDALLNIRNQWGLWVDKINSQYGATKKLSYFLMNFFSKLLGWLDKGVQMLNRLADKVGGMENLLKLVAMAAGSIWLALNASKILGFFKSLGGLLTMANLKTLALVAVIMLIALAIDDLIHFMRGDASVIGEFLEEMGIDADDAREKIQKGIDSVLNFVQKAGSVIKKVIGWLGEWVRAFVDGISAAIGGLIDLFELCKQGWEWLKETPLGKFVGKVGDAVGSAVNSGLEWLQKGADWLTKDGTVQAATASASAGAGNKTNNITIQNHINNTFNGSDREMQQKGAEMTGQAVSDSSEELTKAMATGR